MVLVKFNFKDYLSWTWHHTSNVTLNSYFLGLFEGTWEEYAPLRRQLLRRCICQCWGCSQVFDVLKSINYSLVVPSWPAYFLNISWDNSIKVYGEVPRTNPARPAGSPARVATCSGVSLKVDPLLNIHRFSLSKCRETCVGVCCNAKTRLRTR